MERIESLRFRYCRLQISEYCISGSQVLVVVLLLITWQLARQNPVFLKAEGVALSPVESWVAFMGI